jgi:hypothetical protein
MSRYVVGLSDPESGQSEPCSFRLFRGATGGCPRGSERAEVFADIQFAIKGLNIICKFAVFRFDDAAFFGRTLEN